MSGHPPSCSCLRSGLESTILKNSQLNTNCLEIIAMLGIHLSVLPQSHMGHILSPGTISARLALGHFLVPGPRETVRCACIFLGRHCSFLCCSWVSRSGLVLCMSVVHLFPKETRVVQIWRRGEGWMFNDNILSFHCWALCKKACGARGNGMGVRMRKAPECCWLIPPNEGSNCSHEE